jgi:hypothetical protein
MADHARFWEDSLSGLDAFFRGIGLDLNSETDMDTARQLTLDLFDRGQLIILHSGMGRLT